MEVNTLNLVDQHQRRIRKIRLSLTDKCNLRCHYCMPLDQQFMDESQYLNEDQYFKVLTELHFLGLEELRITGGEPLLRRSFANIITKLAQISWKKIGITTNAILLDKYFDVLLKSNVKYLNISLDSLDEHNFQKISHGNFHSRVMQNIISACKLDFHVKINMVVMRGINDHEILDFVDLSQELGVQVRFLELMNIGTVNKMKNNQYISAREMIEFIKSKHKLIPMDTALDSTSFDFKTIAGASIGFIASESSPFCNHCSRWRLSADGILRACLFKDDGVKLDLESTNKRFAMYQEVLGMKPIMRSEQVAHMMNTIGG